ncbi:MAG: hypothetical protein FIB06_13250 [Betaproteobacteria bacterium]|nr:hypothetical protein [Betaproteobacteria bacterium]
MGNSAVPSRAYTLGVLRAMGECEPILMLAGCDDGYGSRWTLGGQQIQPAVARYLMEAGFIAERGRTQFGARCLLLTELGRAFRERGLNWWRSLTWSEKLRVTVFG